MTKLARRQLLAALAAAPWLPVRAAAKKEQHRVVIVGGGFAGATLARYVRRLAPELRVTLVEARKRYVACPMSNLVMANQRPMEQQYFDYAGLVTEGVDVRYDRAAGVDPHRQVVTLQSGLTLGYERLVLAPGIMLNFTKLPGYSEQGAMAMPHAWQAGAQTLRLRHQIQSMPEDGLVVISVPPAPYRCPPGPYERASLMAGFLKRAKPKARIVLLDSNDRFSKQALFQQGWQRLYPGMIRWISGSNDGRVIRVEPDAGRVHTDFETYQPHVANIIPPQQAGLIAQRAGVTDSSGWCPVDGVSFESTLQKNIHVIGDAAIAAPMPKSAFAANAQAKVCAIALARLLRGLSPQPTVLANTCYSYLKPGHAISIAGAYRNHADGFSPIAEASGASPLNASGTLGQREALHAADWFRVITAETFG